MFYTHCNKNRLIDKENGIQYVVNPSRILRILAKFNEY